MNALSLARPAATLMLERSLHKLDTYRFTVDQLDLVKRLAEKSVNPDAALQEMMHSDGFLRCDTTPGHSRDRTWDIYCEKRSGTGS